MDFLFFLNSFLFGIALAMDAFSVSIANGINEPKMKKSKITLISGTFAFFQAIMPLIGWFCIKFLLEQFEIFSKFIPYIALGLLLFLGIKMIIDSRKCECADIAVGFSGLILQGIATSIDALSVGFNIAQMSYIEAIVCASIIALVTFIICYIGVLIGKKVGCIFSSKAQFLGGVILIIVGIEIFLTGIL